MHHADPDFPVMDGCAALLCLENPQPRKQEKQDAGRNASGKNPLGENRQSGSWTDAALPPSQCVHQMTLATATGSSCVPISPSILLDESASGPSSSSLPFVVVVVVAAVVVVVVLVQLKRGSIVFLSSTLLSLRLLPSV